LKLKILHRESIIGTLLIFSMFLVMPVLLQTDLIRMFRSGFSDVDITDTGFRLIRADESVQAEESIIIINLNNYNNPRLYKLLNIISALTPKVIGVNYLLNDTIQPEYADSLARLFKSYDNIVLSSELRNFDQTRGNYKEVDLPQIPLPGGTKLGFSNLLFGKSKEHNTIRSFKPATTLNNKAEKAFSVSIMEIYNPELARRFLNRNNEYEFINYKGNYDKFILIDALAILRGDFDPTIFKGKIVLIGKADVFAQSHKLSDLYFTPLNENGYKRTAPDMYETIVHANILSMMLREDYFNVLPGWFTLSIAYLICYINFLLFFWVKEKIPAWYEIISNTAFLVESALILYVTIVIFYKFNLKANLLLSIISVGMTVFLFEVYVESIIPLTNRFYHKIIRRKALR
jgi:CHASE2 domain-containing sensor protein